MQTRSFLQRRSHSESSDRLVANIQPRSWGEAPQHQAAQPIRHDFSHVDLFAHDPGPRTIPHGIQAKRAIAPNDAYAPGAAQIAESQQATVETEADSTETTVYRLPFSLHPPDRPSPPVIPWWGMQAKLTIGQPNDVYEQEADQVAEQVMSMALPATPNLQRQVEEEDPEDVQTKPLAATITPLVQRQAQLEIEEEPLQAKCEACEQEEPLQRAADGMPQAQPDVENRLNASQGGGSPLPDDLRGFMEPRFGADFSQVRVHTGNDAVQMSRDLSAQAFTHKQDVYFDAGKAPAKDALTAHELTHVMQQSKSIQLKSNTHELNNSHIQRFSSPEHQDLGDDALKDLAEFLKTPDGAEWGKKNGLNEKNLANLPKDKFLQGNKIKVGKLPELSPGDIIALMGDFYRTPQELMSAPPEEVNKLLEIMRNEGAGKLSGSEADKKYQEVTQQYRKQEDTYVELAKENKPHFTPGNRTAWESLHIQALDKAKQAGSNNALLQEALLIDAAGGHFLTDAFAAGHLFDKNKLEVEIDIFLKNNPPKPKNPEMKAYYALVEFKGALPQLVLKNIHDRLNREGVEVINKKGMQWKTFGDDHLKTAQETRRIAALAIYLSRQQVILAKETAVSSFKADEILDLLPDDKSVEAVTEKAKSYIPLATEAISDLMYRQRKMAGTLLPFPFGKIVESNLGTIGSPGRENQLKAAEEQARRTGLPQPVPSFTILDF